MWYPWIFNNRYLTIDYNSNYSLQIVITNILVMGYTHIGYITKLLRFIKKKHKI